MDEFYDRALEIVEKNEGKTMVRNNSLKLLHTNNFYCASENSFCVERSRRSCMGNSYSSFFFKRSEKESPLRSVPLY